MAGHRQRMLDRFPAFMRADWPGKALGDVMAALGRQLDEAERLTTAIQRSHRIALAEEERDVLQLAASAGLVRADFFILRTFYVNAFFALSEKDVSVTFAGGKTGFDFLLKIAAAGTLDDIRGEIQSKLEKLLSPPVNSVAFRDVVTQLGTSALYRLHGGALTGARNGDQANLDSVTVAIADPADAQDREQRGYDAYVASLRDSVERVIGILLDGCGTIHALLEGASVLLNAATTGGVEHTDQDQPRGGFVHRLPIDYKLVDAGKPFEHQGYVYMIENPIAGKTSDERPRSDREPFRVKRGGFFPGPVAAKITGLGNRTVLPRITNETTHEGIGFLRVLKDGQVLLIGTDGKVYLDGADATDAAYYFHGGLFDLPGTGSGDPGHVSPVSIPAGALDRAYPRPTLTPAATLPPLQLPLGDSDWRFAVEQGAFDLTGFDQAVFTGAPTAPSAKVQLQWQEETPFAVTILLPAAMKSLESAVLGGQDLRRLVRAGLERFRTAGIRLDVDYFDDKWILGRSILRDSSVKGGLGVDFEGTIPSEAPKPE